MRKVSGNLINAGVINNSYFSKTVKQCVANDDAFRFKNSVKETHLTGKQFKSEVLVMVNNWAFQHFFSYCLVLIPGEMDLLK